VHGEKVAFEGLLRLVFGVYFLFFEVLCYLVQFSLEFFDQFLASCVARELCFAEEGDVLEGTVVTMVSVRQAFVLF
jgi:hypothetical protein